MIPPSTLLIKKPNSENLHKLATQFSDGIIFEKDYTNKNDNTIRLTADNPLINKNIIESVLNNHIENKNFYTSNILHRTWPRGLDVEVVKNEYFFKDYFKRDI